MKRQKHIPLIKSATRVFPLLFWCDCKICEMEFRREWGWRVTLNDHFGDSSICFFYFCEKCAPTKDEAEAAFTEKFPKSPLALSSAYIGPVKGE